MTLGIFYTEDGKLFDTKPYPFMKVIPDKGIFFGLEADGTYIRVYEDWKDTAKALSQKEKS